MDQVGPEGNSKMMHSGGSFTRGWSIRTALAMGVSIVSCGQALAQQTPAPQDQQPAASGTGVGVAAAPAAGNSSGVADIVVTANKRSENIQNVGMSIQAESGDTLLKLGVFDTESLQKVIPGFTATPNNSGTNVYTLRGVGFQDSSLAASPTVSVYIDEGPLPFSVMSKGATLDLQRVEVLKGPQGTLFGENATGGAINYIANKPTDTFHAGGAVSYGRFSDAKIDGYISGPITDTLDARIAVQSHTSGPWQEGYGPQAGQTIGGTHFFNGRGALLWKPSTRFKALLTVDGWRDNSFNQEPQKYGIAQTVANLPINPALINYPNAPHNDRAAGFNSCVNSSGFDPIAGQAAGAVWLTPSGARESQGPGSVLWGGGQPTSCVSPRNHDSQYGASLRLDYDLGDDITLTSLTDYHKFTRKEGVDGSAVPYQQTNAYLTGGINTIYQELRLAGKWGGRGTWLIGANYEHDKTVDRNLLTFSGSSGNPLGLSYDSSGYAALFAGSPNSVEFQNGNSFFVAEGPLIDSNVQRTNTYAAYANAEYPIFKTLTFQVGARFTQENKAANGCSYDSGDGTIANLLYLVQQAAGVANPVLTPLGGCATLGSDLHPSLNGFNEHLNQHNVSWRAGLNWKVTPQTLIYANISQGYKGGSFPTIPLEAIDQYKPVVQERLLAYEAGFKTTLLDRQLQINGAGFYYDYTNKQILGTIPNALFGPLQALVNVPKSHVIGFELSGAYSPDWFRGLVISPAVSMQKTRIDSSSKNVCTADLVSTLASEGESCIAGHYYNTDPFGQTADLTGERAPYAPEWQATVDAEYDWSVRDDLKAFIGATAQYTSSTNSSFVNRTPRQPEGPYNLEGVAPNGFLLHPNDPLFIKAYTVVDMRAGLTRGPWRAEIWGRNLFNKYYWTAAYQANDILVRYTGRPVTYGFTLSVNY